MSLQINHLSKIFPVSNRTVIDDINLEIADKEFVCLIGPSGCGKSTLLNMIAGLEKPSSGELVLDGKPITGPGPDKVMMFQESALFPWMTVLENVKYGLKLAGKSRSEQESIAMDFLKLVQLAHFKDYRPHELSGGMKQRTALARALALDSPLLLMDEPFAALDKQKKNKLHEELQMILLRVPRTVVFVTHSVEEAILFADRIVMLSAAPCRIMREFQVSFRRPRHIEAADFLELRADLLGQIRKEVDHSAEREYDQSNENP